MAVRKKLKVKKTLRQALLCPKPGCLLLKKHLPKKRKRSYRTPLVTRPWWSELPAWIALHAERGPVRKCWEGHRLVQARQDGRKHGCCNRCSTRPPAGSPIWVCHSCGWSRCKQCAMTSRLPKLCKDPLFHSPSTPGLLKPCHGSEALQTRGTVIIVPGGNYEFLCPTEGLPVAAWLARHGIHSLVLRYRLRPTHGHKEALADLEAAVQLVRSHKEGPVAALGFSAGGHLVASLSARGRTPLDAQVLVYPAIDGRDWARPCSAGFWDPACNENAESLLAGQRALLGGRGFKAPASFLVGSTNDQVCPAKAHTDPYAAALKKRGIPHEYVRGSLGEHGFGLDRCWSGKCLKWLQQRGFGKRLSQRSWAGCRLPTKRGA